jgi:hypothetical protein
LVFSFLFGAGKLWVTIPRAVSALLVRVFSLSLFDHLAGYGAVGFTSYRRQKSDSTL